MTDIDSGIPSLPGEASLISYRDDFMRLSATRTDSQEIIVSRGVLSPHNRVLSDLLEGRRSLFVVTPSVDRFYGDALRQCIDSGLFNRDSKVVSLNSTEASKDLDAVGDLCNQFKHFGLGRNAPVVAMGEESASTSQGSAPRFIAAVYQISRCLRPLLVSSTRG